MKYFSQADLQKIQEAVKKSEKKIQGEIIPCFVKKSDSYPESFWKAASLFFVLGVFTFYLVEFYFIQKQVYFFRELYWMVLSLSGLFFASFVFISLKVRRFFISPVRMNEKVLQEAHTQFLKNEIFKTKLRSGILILMSLFERKVVILADSGINQKVSSAEWDEIIQELTQSLKNKKYTDGIIQAIERCEMLLIQKGFSRTSENSENELSDKLRFGDDSE